MKIIGLCGGSGSGKGTVSEMFKKFGIPSIDTDEVYHILTSGKSTCLDALVSEFGEEILSSDGSLNRKVLSSIVFNGDDSEKKRQKLNSISHKYVLQRARELLAEFELQGKAAAIVDAPLLFESGFNTECDVIVAVVADESARVKRITERDKITKEYAEARIKSQLPDIYLIKNADYVINNSYDTANTNEQVINIVKKILDTEN